jgi:general stress protein 26
MDSINAQQPEENHEDLKGAEAGSKIKALAEKAGTCYLCTGIAAGRPIQVRPMSPQKVDGHGNFWFLSSVDSHKNAQIEQDPHVQLLFQGSTHSDFLTVWGTATISTDRELIRNLWEPILKTWFTDGVDDPRITVIQVETKEGYYWDTKHGNAVAFAKTIAGAFMGKTLDDSIEGRLIP